MSEDVQLEPMPDLVIVTGMSGAGRTEAMHVFEDLGYFCVDNLPSNLIGSLVDLTRTTGVRGATPPDPSIPQRLAVVCDSRNGDFFGILGDELQALRDRGIDYAMFFLDADDEKLVARYKSSRRRHPMCADGTSIAQGIARERELLARFRDSADYRINTTEMMPQKLRSTIRSLLGAEGVRKGLAVTV